MNSLIFLEKSKLSSLVFHYLCKKVMGLKTIKQHLLLFALSISLFACTSKQEQICGYAFQYEMTGKWGLVSTEGKLLTTEIFTQQPTSVINGMFSVPNNQGLYQLYNVQLPTLAINEQSFYRIGHFFEEVTWAQETPYSPLLLINKQGKVIATTSQYPQYDIRLAYNFSEGLAIIATNEGKYGYMDIHGNIVIPPIYDRANSFNDQLALVGMSNAMGNIGFQLINKDGKTKTSIRLNNCIIGDEIEHGLIPYKNIETGQCGFIDYEGIPFINLPENIYYTKSIQNGNIIFLENANYGITDINGTTMLEPIYKSIKDLGSDRLALLTNDGWILSNENGQIITNNSFCYIGKFNKDDYAIAKQKNSYFFIDKDGNKLSIETYASLIDEETAFYGNPQIFFIQDSTKQAVVDNDKQKVTKHVTTKHQDKISKIDADSWKNIAQESPFYDEAKKILKGNLDTIDSKNRQMILNYVEHLRTSYITKDIDFLEQLFSENALIIVGTVIKMTPQVENHYLPPEQVIYNVKSKREYLDKLKLIFQANQTIELTFNDFRIMRHPTKRGIYGVVLRQGYRSDYYSDDGYLFLLWDFRDETAPKIHVRTWQPSMLENGALLDKDDVFDIGNFNLQ